MITKTEEFGQDRGGASPRVLTDLQLRVLSLAKRPLHGRVTGLLPVEIEIEAVAGLDHGRDVAPLPLTLFVSFMP